MAPQSGPRAWWTPPLVRDSQVGRPVALNVTVPVPPLAVRLCEYESPDVVAGSVAEINMAP